MRKHIMLSQKNVYVYKLSQKSVYVYMLSQKSVYVYMLSQKSVYVYMLSQKSVYVYNKVFVYMRSQKKLLNFTFSSGWKNCSHLLNFSNLIFIYLLSTSSHHFSFFYDGEFYLLFRYILFIYFSTANGIIFPFLSYNAENAKKTQDAATI